MLVFDTNWNSVEDLYLGMGSFPSRLLFQIAEARQARRLGWQNGVTRLAGTSEEAVFRVRQRMPAGWFITGGFLTMPFLARYARKLSATHLGKEEIDIAAFTSPHYLPLKRALKPEFAIYHAVDDYAEYWPKRVNTTRRREGEMIAEADLVVCAGAFLADFLKGMHPDRAADTYHIPNPVPFEFLASEPTISPYFDGRRSKPIFGYVGAIDGRLDCAAMLELARSAPLAEIRVHASQDVRDCPLSEASNIVMSPPVPRSEVPALIRDFDVCLLPQSRTHFNLCASPRKLYEYLGSSRPIVALNTPEAESLGPHVISTGSREEFVNAALGLVEHGEEPGGPARRLDMARELTPQALAHRYANIVRKYRSRPKGAGGAWPT